ncbi:MAG: hypothetical protein F6K40_16745 [Okeania sp. SIO3I5]|uniref:hypothetical protein n=1 Tax=Okeania sp. SIO3I5 TaxID=2607805 RepID=UPI0013B98A70|nr:hypothetical protein [Okeania sp. SIO3I5]NEQ37818.1 hypothetical protein [Okeania sp. SIO3I5]
MQNSSLNLYRRDNKACLVGIKVFLNEESYTSIASFLDLDELPVDQKGVKHGEAWGLRVKRGLDKATKMVSNTMSHVNVRLNTDMKSSLKRF